jgi:hypothetical protein
MDDELLHLSKQHNHLKDRVEQDRLDNNTSTWLRISSVLDFFQSFPKVQENDLRELTLCISSSDNKSVSHCIMFDNFFHF